MFTITWWRKIAQTLSASLIVGALLLGLVSCKESPIDSGGDRSITQIAFRRPGSSQTQKGDISEVSPPEVIQQLRQSLEIYQPQVAILNPQPEEVLQNNTVEVRLQVKDLPIFKNEQLNLGPHLHVILDNQPYVAAYDLDQPIKFSDLSPGTHTLRVFASRPWHESFKNEGAYAQTTFHVLTKNSDNHPEPNLPLLTYSRPQGSYGAEPIMLDFYLTNAPLHLVAQENTQDDISDWRIRCTINGNSFILDRWVPIYLKGFKPGQNWVQLEFLDEQGNLVKNVFNDTVRLMTYEPKGQDTLSKLVRGELSLAEARGIVEQNYTAKVPAPTPSLEPTPTPSPTPSVENTPAAEDEEDKAVVPDVETESEPVEQDTEKINQQKPGGYFNRFRSPFTKRTPNLPPPSSTNPDVTAPEKIEPEPQLPDVTAPEKIESEPQLPDLIAPEKVEPVPQLEVAPTEEPAKEEIEKINERKPGGYFSRFRRQPETRSPITAPDTVPEPQNSPELAPQEEPAPSNEIELPSTTPALKGVKQPDNPALNRFFDRFRRPNAAPSPTLPPTLPEIVDPSSSELVPPAAREGVENKE